LKQKRRNARLKSTTFNELNKPINLGFRKVQKNRTSISMILPKIWTDSNGVEVGDKVQVIMELNGTLSVRKSRGER